MRWYPPTRVDTFWAMACVALAVVLGASAPLQAVWWHADWAYRRPVVLAGYEPTGLPGDDVAVVTMPTAGLMTDDGRDIRVTTKGGVRVDHRVLMVGPGDEVTIAFGLSGKGERYFVYFGNAAADAPAEELEIQRGVLQESWRNPGGKMRTLADVQATLSKADTLIGRGFRGQVFQGHNPFGPGGNVASIFTAYFMVSRDGEYTFCTSSRNASFLEIDGQLVVSNGGRHPPQGNVSKQGDIELTAGMHRVRFYHVSPGGNPVVVLAWQTPGGDRIWPMLPPEFTPIVRGAPQGLQENGPAVTVDFLPTHAGESFMEGRYFQRYTFDALNSGTVGSQASWRWDFGDGATATGRSAEHVYLVAGEYTVTLTVQTRIGELTRTNRIAVSRPWDMVTQSETDALGDYARLVAAYDFTTLRADAVAEAMALLVRAGNTRAVAAAGEALLLRENVPAAPAVRAMGIYSRVLLRQGKPARAAEVLLGGVDIIADDRAEGALLVGAGWITLDDLAQPDAALTLFERGLAKLPASAQGSTARDAHRGVGDVRRLAGDLSGARQAYALAGQQGQALPGRESFEAGNFARHVEAYSLAKDYPAAQAQLDAWARQQPAVKLDGYWSLLQVKLYMLQGDHKAAAGEAEVVVGVNPETSYGAELLMLAANAHSRAGEPGKVRSVLEEIVAKYPESPYAVEAAEALGD